MTKQYTKSLWWVKRDFRLLDNEAFSRALWESDEVLPVMCYEPLLLNGKDWGPFQTYALWQAQTSLRKNLKAFGSDMYVSVEDAIETFETLHKIYPFEVVYSYEETGLTHTFERDRNVASWCAAHDIAFIEIKNNGVIRKLKSRDTWEKKFKAFIDAPQSKASRLIALPDVALSIAQTTLDPTKEFLNIEHINISNTKDPHSVVGDISEAQGHKVLKDFLSNRSHGYTGGMSAMNKAVVHSSHLSVHLAWGTLSLKQVFHATEKKREEVGYYNDYQWSRSLTSFKSRLYWHAHFVQKLEDQVDIELYPQNRAFQDTLPYVTDEELQRRLSAWERGTTGYPMIDASMRYFAKYGWLNFRSRSMVASFAMHALRIDWRIVLYSMARYMIDYVPGIHVSQIQMQAGLTGGNTIRVYSPMKQMKDHDPEAVFIKSSLPELTPFSAEDIESFEIKTLGSYPKPIIDFKNETKIMKDALYAIKKSEYGKQEAERVYQKHGSRMRRSW